MQHFFLQLKPTFGENTLPGLLIIAVTGCVAAIVWMAIYIVGLHKKHMAFNRETLEELSEFRNALEKNTAALEMNTEVKKELITSQREFHQFIVQHLIK